jgi:uncharacterized protein HemY
MLNLLIAFAAGAVVFGLVSLWLGPIPATIPAVLVSALVVFLLTRRISGILEAEVAAVAPMLQNREVDRAKAHLQSIKERYGKWQLLLDRQLDAQLGMIDYLQMKYDEALPHLERGKWRNWQALVCIAAIHHRRGEADKAWEHLELAAAAGSKEVMVYLVWATLLVRAGKRTEALEVLTRGLKEQPDSRHLQNLKKRIANKKKVDIKQFPDTWYQFFPEDMARQMVMRGRRGGAGPLGAVEQPRIGARRAPRR